MLALILILIIFLRYLVFSFIIERIVSKSKLTPIFNFKRKVDQTKKEIINSFYSSIIFGIGMWGLYLLWLNDLLQMASNNDSFLYHIASILIALLIHETYYYWLHRLMHTKRFYKFIHQGHHDSVRVSTWTAFSFDILETILQVLAFYIIAFLVPLHLYSILFLLVFMSLSATINHLNHEVYPQFFKRIFPFNQLIGATHHALHHKEFKTNYGLYFTFWDKWMGTESKTTIKENLVQEHSDQTQ